MFVNLPCFCLRTPLKTRCCISRGLSSNTFWNEMKRSGYVWPEKILCFRGGSSEAAASGQSLQQSSVCAHTTLQIKCSSSSSSVFSCVADSSSGWVAVTSQREAVELCLQFSAPSPLVWEIWTWVTTTCRIQEWNYCVMDWTLHTVHWKLSG